MIQPLSFSSNLDKENKLFSQFNRQATVVNPAKRDVVEVAAKKEPVLKRAKKGFINTLKGFNSTTSMVGGAAKGVTFGALTTAGVGIIAKNIKESNSNIWGSLKGIAKDTFKCAKKLVCALPAVVTKAPIENAKSLVKLPGKFFNEYMKNNKALAVGALAAGGLVLALNLISAKINANRKNADVDHKFNSGHVA